MRDTNTNELHVVALTRKVWDGWPADLSPVDKIEKYRVARSAKSPCPSAPYGPAEWAGRPPDREDPG